MQDTHTLTSTATRILEPGRVIGRAQFDRKAAGLHSDAVKQHAHGGSAFRQSMRELCAGELHSRATDDAAGLLAVHKSLNCAPSDEMLVACKDWIAARVADDADDLKRHLWKPSEAFGGRGQPETLADEARRETDGASATIYAAFERLRSDRWERVQRWGARLLRSLGFMAAGAHPGP